MIDESTQVRVRFTTSLERYRVSEAPFVIPARLGRSGLREILQHLLAQEKSEEDEENLPVFDFQIGDQLLRMPLYRFVQSHRLSTEETLTIRYFVAAQLKESAQQEEQPAWISVLQASLPLMPKLSLAGYYDGCLRLVDSSSLRVVGEVAAHEEPVSAMTALKADNLTLLASGSHDCTVKVWQARTNEESPSLSLRYTLRGHSAGVHSLCDWHAENVLSGDWNGTIFAWNLSFMHGRDMEEEKIKVSKKRKTASSAAVPMQEEQEISSPLFSLKGHSQCVSSLHTSGNKAYSSSWDHSVRVWDLERQDNVWTANSGRVFLALDPRHDGLLASAHPDGKLRVWDERKKDNAGQALHVLGSSPVWISQVRIPLLFLFIIIPNHVLCR